MGLADLHIHTKDSDGTFSVEQLLDHVQERTSLDVIAVTEHDDIRGSLKAVSRSLNRGYRFVVVPGVEITTRQGHLIALNLTEQPPFMASAEDTIRFVHDHGGYVIAAHPLAKIPLSFSQRTISAISQHPDFSVYLDGIEVCNPTPAGRSALPKIMQLNSAVWNLPEVGSSDAHFLEHVGSTVTYFSGHTPEELFRSLQDSKTVAIPQDYAKIAWHRLVAQQFRGLSATPRKVIQRSLTARVPW